MDDKNESKKLMEEFKRINREKFEKFYETICESFDNFLERKSLVKDDWEMKCPYKKGDILWMTSKNGELINVSWENDTFDNDTFLQGNAFPTEQEAEIEVERRNLLTRFRAFRDECNGDWKPNWRKNDAKYYFYISSTDGAIGINDIYFYEIFPLFGYFKNEQDAQRAIELFDDEIKTLFVDCEEE